MTVAHPIAQAPGAALRLVREVTLAEGPLFSSRAAMAAARELGMSADSAYKALSLAAQAGIAIRLKGGLYRAAPPFGPALLHEFLVATTLVRPSVISGPSALSHWSLIDQTPLRIVTASSPKTVLPPMSRGASAALLQQVGHHGWVIEGVTYIYRKIPQSEMFGISDVWLDTETQVPMFDRERAVLDTFLHPRVPGSGYLGELLLEEHLQDLDLDRLQRYAHITNNPRVIARVADAGQRAAPVASNADL
jgi:predicted transcriptional regulator of viral defense system